MQVEISELDHNIYFINVPYYDIGTGIIILDKEEKTMIDAATKESASKFIVPTLNKLGITKIDKLLLTHGDHDHIGGAVTMKKIFGARILASRITEDYTKDPTMAFQKRFGLLTNYLSHEQARELIDSYYNERDESFTLDEYLYEDAKIKINSHRVIIINMEGHIDGALGFYYEDLKMLVCGDSIQGEGVLSQQFTPFPMYDNVRKYLHTLERVKKLNLDKIVCAHPYLPSYSPIVSGKTMRDLINKSIEYVNIIDKLVLEGINKEKTTLKEITEYVCHEMGISTIPTSAFITIKAHLDDMRDKSIIRWLDESKGKFETL
jgi:glyoxylase-like metal-dependent hydrolase (beta-lactamase superfamily II)